MPSPKSDKLIADIAIVEVTTAPVIANCSKKWDRLNNPTVLILRLRFAFVQVNKLLGIVIHQEFMVESEVGRREP